MLRHLVLLLALVLLSPFAGAQEKESADVLNRKAIDALTAKKYDEGAELLLRILAIPGREKDNGTAYNLACAYSLKGELDKGFEWLGKAVDWGWGPGSGTLVGSTKTIPHTEMTKTDPDLENLRKDPRFEPLMERMTKAVELREAMKKKGEEYAATAAIYIPEKVKALAEMPVLIVLHDAGSTKDAVVAGPWKAIADELGFALIAPSGKILVGDEPEKGMTWIEDLASYKAKYWSFEKPATDAITAFKKEHPTDKSRIAIAGEGVGGLLALNTAIGSPGLIKGVVALNSGPNPDLMAAKAPTAGKMGLRARILIEAAALSKLASDAGQKEEDGPKIVAGWTKLLQTWGITGEARTISGDAAATKAAILEALKAVLERDPAAEPKPEDPKK